MKAVLIQAPGTVTVAEVPRPEPQDGDVLVRMRCCGVCGTDLEKVHGQGITTTILGHEVVGEVAGLGGSVAGLSVGDRVFTHHHVPCYECETCSRGSYTYCGQFSKTNLVPCGLAEYYVVPKYNVDRGAVLKLPDELGYEEASFIEPLACCILGLRQARAAEARSALVYGAGPVGLMHLKLLRSYGVARVGVADISGYRLGFAEKLGADYVFNPADKPGAERAGKGPDLVVLATGSVAALEDALGTAARGGRVLLFGAPKRGAVATLDMGRFFLRGVDLVTSYSASERETSLARDMIASGGLVVSDMVTHRFPLARSEEAFEAASKQQCVKALITA